MRPLTFCYNAYRSPIYQRILGKCDVAQLVIFSAVLGFTKAIAQQAPKTTSSITMPNGNHNSLNLHISNPRVITSQSSATFVALRLVPLISIINVLKCGDCFRLNHPRRLATRLRLGHQNPIRLIGIEPTHRTQPEGIEPSTLKHI